MEVPALQPFWRWDTSRILTGLMRQAAANRLLVLLSDGKSNDKDDYQARYGVEYMRQAIIEASLQGIYYPFCLSIEHQLPA